MIKTNTFVKSMLDKGIADDVAFLENGYDIQVNGVITSVRLNDKGDALIWNHKRNDVLEVSSGRLDDVLHKYIIKCAVGTQTREGVHNIKCSDAYLVPTKIINNAVVFEDCNGKRFVVSNTTPEAILSYYNDASSVNADDCMILLNGFEPYTAEARRNIKSSVESSEVELQLLRCSVNVDDYAVSPKSELINNVGQTIVGNFLCSSADKLNYMTFEEDVEKHFVGSRANRSVKSSTVRSKNPFAVRAQVALNSAASKKAVNDYLNAKYPEGLSVKAVESALAYETASLFKAANIHEPLNYQTVFNHFCKNADKVTFRLDSNKSILAALEVTGKSVAKFRAIPDAEGIKNALYRNGYSLTELESGVTFDSKDEVIGSIVASCRNFAPVTEAVVNTPNTVSKFIGQSCVNELSRFGMDVKVGVFNSVVKVVLN